MSAPARWTCRAVSWNVISVVFDDMTAVHDRPTRFALVLRSLGDLIVAPSVDDQRLLGTPLRTHRRAVTDESHVRVASVPRQELVVDSLQDGHVLFVVLYHRSPSLRV